MLTADLHPQGFLVLTKNLIRYQEFADLWILGIQNQIFSRRNSNPLHLFISVIWESAPTMSESLPYSMKDVQYDNAKFRRRSLLKVRVFIFHLSRFSISFEKIDYLVFFFCDFICFVKISLSSDWWLCNLPSWRLKM